MHLLVTFRKVTKKDFTKKYILLKNFAAKVKKVLAIFEKQALSIK